jgi:hypothetical protein
MPAEIERALPPELLRRASLRAREYAWSLDDIPHVIEAARAARLINIGGQLQFRLPEGGACECYWIEVDTYRDVDKQLSWDTRVQLTAEAAQRQFAELPPKDILVEAGRRAFGPPLAEAENAGHRLADLMYFVWYLAAEQDDR